LAAEETALPAVTRLIELRYAGAPDLARQFAAGADGEDAQGSLLQERREFLHRAMADATRGVRPVPQVMQEPGLYPSDERAYAEARVAQAGGGPGSLAALLPNGLSEPPTAVPNQNALLVRGTATAVDEFAEIVRLLDVPPKQVNIEVKLINLLERAESGWGADVAGRGANAGFLLRGPAPAGPSVQILGDNVEALVAANRSISRANSSTGASITTTNNTPCVIRAVTVIPVVLASAVYDQWGNRHLEYTVDAVATGVELFALPRISEDDTITMRLRPTFIDATGQVVGPDGSALPVTQQNSVDTVIRVKDGESALLGGFPRSSQALQATGLPVNLRRSGTVESIEARLFVTPRIVRLIEP
jgi:type II secretory pathway component GspD/PulD (secretin)